MAETWQRWLVSLLLAGSAACTQAAGASQPDVQLDEHVNRLTSELRCLVCQNQTVADSQAELAVQLKNEVRQQLGKGASDQQVLDFMVARYGDFILYRPPLRQSTWLLWAGPVLLLLLGAVLFVAYAREQRRRASDTDDDEREDAEKGTTQP